MLVLALELCESESLLLDCLLDQQFRTMEGVRAVHRKGANSSEGTEVGGADLGSHRGAMLLHIYEEEDLPGIPRGEVFYHNFKREV